MASKGNRTRILGGGAIAFFIFGVVTSMRHFFDSGTDRAILGLITFSLIFGTLAWGVSRWIHTPADERALLCSILSSGILLALGTVVQLVGNYSGALAGRQLAGTTENPNSFGANIAMVLPVACYLVVTPQVRRFWRITAGIFAGVGLILLLWSGSRSSALGAALAISILFQRRLKLWFTAILLGGAALVVVMGIFGIELTGLEHLGSTANSRTEVFNVMVDQFFSSPLVGVGSTGLHENSYLGTAAAFGIAGLFPLLIALWFIWRNVRRAAQTMRETNGDVLLGNLLRGSIAGALLMSVFEAHLAGTFTHFIFCFYLFLALAVAVGDPTVADDRAFEPAMDEEPGMEFEHPWGNPADSLGGQYF
jgi:hypothetical protein